MSRTSKSSDRTVKMIVPPYWKGFLPDCERFLHEDNEGYLTVFYQWAEKYQSTHVIAALVPNEQVKKALDFKGFVSAHVESSGDIYWGEEEFTPWFKVELNNTNFEPLVLHWQCGANYLSSAIIDPKFCMTYQLCPRLEGEKIIWDDRSKPEYRIAQQTVSNRYDWGSYEQVAEVKIRKDYIDRYLSIRKATLILLFDSQIKIPAEKQNKVSSKNQYYEENFTQGQGRLSYSRDRSSEEVFVILSYAAVQLKSNISSEDEYEGERAIAWPGDSEPMTYRRATGFDNDYEYAFFKEEILSEYQKDPDIEVNPLSFVKYGGQWSLGFSRVGRNHIQVRMKELYQDINTMTRNRWHRYAVLPSLVSHISDEENIGSRTKNLYEAYKSFCETLADVSWSMGVAVGIEEISGIDFRKLEYNGWWTNPYLNTLAFYAPENMSEDEFLKRCTNLEKSLEHLKPAPLKQILSALGIQGNKINSLQRNKLIQALLNLAQYAKSQGLSYGTITANQAEGVILDRNPIVSSLFWLNDLRQYASHNKDTNSGDYISLIANLGANKQTREWGKILDKIYDLIIQSLEELTDALQNPIHFESFDGESVDDN